MVWSHDIGIFCATVTISIGCVDYMCFFEGILKLLYVCNSAFSDVHSATENLGKSLGTGLHHMQPIY